ncbi:TspO and MBR like protein [Tistrella mobilis KA081020-065]|uniref:TspO and MBR like protein n=1 Tax=Tistrella mobilis (strain KA081020-065) TaxID=1110502 RepID=I3THV9_TISMK|nr:TspO and MBR like protein [Tistrella mobilis KA081020-065]
MTSPSAGLPRTARPPVFSGRSLLALLGFLALSAVVSGLGGAVTTPEIDGWYRTLPKPGFTPPDWVFAPVWTTLYILMAVAAWRVWRKAGIAGARGALGLHLVQLALNLAWSVLFFGLHQVGLALVDILVLLVAVTATAIAFGRHDRPAGLLMLPYLAWGPLLPRSMPRSGSISAQDCDEVHRRGGFGLAGIGQVVPVSGA